MPVGDAAQFGAAIRRVDLFGESPCFSRGSWTSFQRKTRIPTNGFSRGRQTETKAASV
jgi:hypothetical protein